MNTNTLFSYDFTRKAIVVSATTLKKTRNPDSPECKTLMRMLAEHPDFCVAEKEINKKDGKQGENGAEKDLFHNDPSCVFSKPMHAEKEYAPDGADISTAACP